MTIMAHASVSCRPATAADYDDVMAINRGIYKGADYLAAAYHWMLHTADNYPYVGLVDGRIVAFTNYRVLNGGRSLMKMSGRIIPSYQGQGVIGHVLNTAETQLQTQYPDVTEVVWCSHSVEDRIKPHIQSGQMQILQKWVCRGYRIDMAAFERASLRTDVAGDADFLSTYAALANIDILLDIVKKHSPHLLQSRFSKMAVQTTPENMRQTLYLNDVIATRRGDVISSFSLTCVWKSGINLDVVHGHFIFYGDVVSDCITHLRMFVNGFKTPDPDAKMVVLHIILPDGADATPVDDTLGRAGWQNMVLDPYYYMFRIKL